MTELKRETFYLTSSSKEELLELLLRLIGKSKESYAQSNGIEEGKIEENIDWAINSIGNEIELKIRLLGYIAKDSRVEGIFMPVTKAEERLNELNAEAGASTSLPIHIDLEKVVTKEIEIDTRVIVNAVTELNSKIALIS